MAYPLEEELGRTCGFFLWLASAPGPNWQVAFEADQEDIPAVIMMVMRDRRMSWLRAAVPISSSYSSSGN
jgi:hypothetical protein